MFCVQVGLLGEVVDNLGEVDHLPEHAEIETAVGVPRFVVGRADVVVALGREESLGQTLEDVDEGHDGLGAPDDLAVDGGLDVILEEKGFFSLLSSQTALLYQQQVVLLGFSCHLMPQCDQREVTSIWA